MTSGQSGFGGLFCSSSGSLVETMYSMAIWSLQPLDILVTRGQVRSKTHPVIEIKEMPNEDRK